MIDESKQDYKQKLTDKLDTINTILSNRMYLNAMEQAEYAAKKQLLEQAIESLNTDQNATITQITLLPDSKLINTILDVILK